jgi:hypothetical protein
LDLKKILSGEATDLVLQEGDIVYVPGHQILKRGLDAAIQGATTAAIYASRP